MFVSILIEYNYKASLIDLRPTLYYSLKIKYIYLLYNTK